jgi:hypothetical protein
MNPLKTIVLLVAVAPAVASAFNKCESPDGRIYKFERP